MAGRYRTEVGGIRPPTRVGYMETLDRQWIIILNRCPITRFPGGLWSLRQADEDATSWLGMQNKR